MPRRSPNPAVRNGHLRHNPWIAPRRLLAGGLFLLAIAIAGLGMQGYGRSAAPAVLTFDDGPQNVRDDGIILRALRAHHVRAVWFITCAHLDPRFDPRASDHQATLRKIVADGHLLGNHGYSHLDLTRLPAGELGHEIADCSALIRRVAGVEPRYFRPPFGRHNPAVDAAARRAGMSTVLWSANSYDSLLDRFKTHPQEFAGFIRRNPGLDVATHLEPGAVVLLHDYANTALVIEDLLSRAQGSGVELGLPANGESLPDG